MQGMEMDRVQQRPSDIPDVDIDVANHDDAVKPFTTAIVASQMANGQIVKHNVGLYFQNIPVNPLNGLAAFEYHHAEALGYYKVDVIAAGVYQNITSQEHLRQLLDEPIEWWWFENPEFVGSLFQLGNWGDLVAEYKPQSIMDLAMLVAIIRPGKKYLKGQSWDVVREKIWLVEPVEEARPKPFKKSHAVAYALVVGLDARLKAPEFFGEDNA